MSAHYVLDQNFPWHVLRFDWPPDIRLSPLSELAPHLTADYEDWQILVELDQRGDVDGFITNDAKMLQLPTEMVALLRSRLTLVVTERVGHNALRATGLIMVHLEEIVKRTSGKPQIYLLQPGRLIPMTPGDQINKLASRNRVQPNEMISRELPRIQRSTL